MESTGVVGILLVVHGDVLIEARQSFVGLFPIRSDSERMIVGVIGFVVDESGLVGSGQVSSLAVVVPRAVEELTVSIRKRFSEFLAPKVHIGIEV